MRGVGGAVCATYAVFHMRSSPANRIPSLGEEKGCRLKGGRHCTCQACGAHQSCFGKTSCCRGLELSSRVRWWSVSYTRVVVCLFFLSTHPTSCALPLLLSYLLPVGVLEGEEKGGGTSLPTGREGAEPCA